MNENISVMGHVKAVLYDSSGKLKQIQHFPNLVVSVGKAHITSRMLSGSANVMGWMEVGTSNTSPQESNTTLGSAISGSRTALSSSTQTTTITTNDSIEYECTFAPGVGTGAIVEAGVFNAASAGNMLCRAVFGTITKGSGDTLVLTWTISLSGNATTTTTTAAPTTTTTTTA
jgi:hypothetical protein